MWTVFQEFVGMFMISLHTFHMPGSIGPVIIAMRPKAECRFCMAIILLFCIQQQKTTLQKLHFFLSLLPHKMSGLGLK
jgi:hypothetical protein